VKWNRMGSLFGLGWSNALSRNYCGSGVSSFFKIIGPLFAGVCFGDLNPIAIDPVDCMHNVGACPIGEFKWCLRVKVDLADPISRHADIAPVILNVDH